MTKRIKSSILIAMMAVSTMGMEECNYLAPEENDSSSGGSSTETGTYTYSFTCAGSSTRNNIPIPNRLSPSCRSAWEFYARTYGCNDADRFAEAERQKRACP